MMSRVETMPRFEGPMKRMDHYTQRMIRSWISKHLMAAENPTDKGKALVDNQKGLWRYRIGGYRLICHLHDDELIILALSLGHRKDAYR
ncbi:MAG TPA: type II toxin-antitoxin system RelE/ParE family toxin [Tissierellia bacterium]|nr:type II toxin-antitoxin system RelE/ParE family toxin [Tissierellia bacterium]